MPASCTTEFQDVSNLNGFRPQVSCLTCRGVLSGYGCGGPGEPCVCPTNNAYFRLYNNVTRGQAAKIIAVSAGFNEDPGSRIYEDVPSSNTFYPWINRLSMRGIMGGYPCGGTGEPCGSGNRPYFRPFNEASRGHIAKIVSNAWGFIDQVSGQIFEDVPADSTFYTWVQRLYMHGVMGGYPCGSPGEPCVLPNNRPYFRPYNATTRAQSSKIISNSFFPNCNPVLLDIPEPVPTAEMEMPMPLPTP
ncbi:MAG TPA: S-layer homology domain-containing protein [Chloroflexia bacterium]|nr:S-layer homology domain-containing protein [Chloroflexia bacterium]